MKKGTIILIILFVFTIQSKAQIPNGGFEQWESIGNFMEPVGFLTPNAEANGPFYPITRSTDHFPANIGDYSIRIENNSSLLPSTDGLGVVLQNNNNVILNGPGPTFPIVGHPTSLTGYYRYAPQNGDTMLILVILFQNGTPILGDAFMSNDTAIEWTSFTLPFSNYTSADSGSILLAAYNANGHPPQYIPHGNSVLYVDNLNFDDLINSVNEYNFKNKLFNLYPNPASYNITLSIDHAINTDMTLNIYNLIGELIQSENISQSRQNINIADFTSGIYIVEIKTKESTERQKLIIQ